VDVLVAVNAPAERLQAERLRAEDARVLLLLQRNFTERELRDLNAVA